MNYINFKTQGMREWRGEKGGNKPVSKSGSEQIVWGILHRKSMNVSESNLLCATCPYLLDEFLYKHQEHDENLQSV